MTMTLHENFLNFFSTIPYCIEMWFRMFPMILSAPFTDMHAFMNTVFFHAQLIPSIWESSWPTGTISDGYNINGVLLTPLSLLLAFELPSFLLGFLLQKISPKRLFQKIHTPSYSSLILYKMIPFIGFLVNVFCGYKSTSWKYFFVLISTTLIGGVIIFIGKLGVGLMNI